MTKNDSLIYSFFSDRLAMPFISLEMVSEVFETIEFVHREIGKVKIPLILFQGEKDSIVNFDQCVKFFNDYQYLDKQMISYPNGYHELQHDYECFDFIKRMLEWADYRCSENSNPI